MTEPDDAGQALGPYATAANTYRQAGWSPLPLPHGQKKSPPNGWTGRDGAWPSGADVQAWCEDHAGGNIALRMPLSVLGIDVDDYKDKPGAAVLDELEKTHGQLPPTWISSSRGGRSGIRFYHIPTGLRWPGVLGPGIETIRYDHRYAVAWPSLHPEGGTYRWTRPDHAIALGEVPTVDELPPLPQTWVEALTGGLLSTDQPRADLRRTDIDSWLYGHEKAPPCRVMQTVMTRGIADLWAAGTSRHDTALALSNRIAWLAGEGHTGGSSALAVVGRDFNLATADRHEDGEWDRMVDGAVRLSAAAHPNKQPDPCITPWAGILKEQPWTTPTTTLTNPKASTYSAPPDPSDAASTATTTPYTTAQPDASSTDATAPDSLTDRTSWWPRHPDHALNPDNEEPGPTILTRDDGQALFYPGRINGLIAPSESGKTWIALHAAAQVVEAGGRVTIIDFEDTHRGVTARLQALGLTDDQLRDHVAYIGPDEPLALLYPTGHDLNEHLDTWQPALIILDGVNAAMGVHGLDLVSNKDATLFAQHVLKPLTRTGAAVVYVDHTPKDKDNQSAGGIGAQAKRAMTTGCAIRVHVNKQFGKGQNGTLTLNVDKDRQGDVRGASKPSGEGGHWAGTAQLTSHDDGTVSIVIESPDTRIQHRQDAPAFRPTVYMQRVADYIEANPGQSRNIIKGCVRGEPMRIVPALQLLIDEGWVRVEKDGQAHRHYTARMYSDLVAPVDNSPLPVDNLGITPQQTQAQPGLLYENSTQNGQTASTEQIGTGVDRGWTGVGPGLKTPVSEPGLVGLTEQDVVLRPTHPGTPPSTHPGSNGQTNPCRDHWVKRTVAGRVVLVHDVTGEVRDD